jgi:hypothetical protein
MSESNADMSFFKLLINILLTIKLDTMVHGKQVISLIEVRPPSTRFQYFYGVLKMASFWANRRRNKPAVNNTLKTKKYCAVVRVSLSRSFENARVDKKIGTARSVTHLPTIAITV